MSAQVSPPLPPKGWLSARVGVEYLASASSPVVEHASPTSWDHLDQEGRTAPGSASGVQVESARTESTRSFGVFATHDPEKTELPWLSAEALQNIENPAERFTLNFLDQLIGEDRRRIQRQLGAPILFNHLRNVTSLHAGFETSLDRADREDQALLLSRERGRLLNRPLRRALKKSTTILRDLDEILDDFKADNVPLTGPYEEEQRRRKWGRLSLRLRPMDFDNPAEIAYHYEGWRVGTASERLKVSFQKKITDDVFVSLRAHYHYEPHLIDLWGDLHYEMSKDTQVHLLLGDKMDIVTGSTIYPVVHSPVALRSVDQSPGAMFYVEHIF